MKYNIKYLLGVSLLSLALVSCNDFLDEKPSSELTDENLGIDNSNKDSLKYTTAIQAEQLLAGAYTDFSAEFWQLDWYIINDAQADNSYAGEPNDQRMQIDEFRVTPTNQNVSRAWGAVYKHIAKTNAILTWVPRITDPTLSSQRRNEILGEASLIRALCYFNLVRIYDHIPLITEDIPEISTENIDEIYPLLYPAQTSKDSVYTQILKDLDFAVANVPDYSGTNKFKITRALTNLITAQVYATKDGFANTQWAKVKQYAEAVVNDGRYGLLDNYDDIFTIGEKAPDKVLPKVDLKNEHSKESLFEVNYTGSPGLGNWGASMFYGVDWKKFNTPSLDLYKAFTAAGDVVRRDASIRFGDVTGLWADKYWPSNAYPFCNKLRSQEKGNIILFRLPEAILLLAEAENELGNSSKAKELINKVRTRATLPNTTANSKEDIRLAIENENRFEFAFEGKRFFDLKRRERFIPVMKSCGDHQKDYASRLNENRLVWPIPQSEMDQNVNLTQNPGY